MENQIASYEVTEFIFSRRSYRNLDEQCQLLINRLLVNDNTVSFGSDTIDKISAFFDSVIRGLRRGVDELGFEFEIADLKNRLAEFN